MRSSDCPRYSSRWGRDTDGAFAAAMCFRWSGECDPPASTGGLPRHSCWSRSDIEYDNISRRYYRADGFDNCRLSSPLLLSLRGRRRSRLRRPDSRVQNISNLKMLIPVPANSIFVSTSISGGSVPGGAPSVALVGSNVVLTVPAPINGGTSFTPPAVTINVTANAPGTITSKYAGTSYSSHGMTMTTRVTVPIIGGTNVATSCYPNPSPTLTTTNVT